jgi:hypothetical protein
MEWLDCWAWRNIVLSCSEAHELYWFAGCLQYLLLLYYLELFISVSNSNLSINVSFFSLILTISRLNATHLWLFNLYNFYGIFYLIQPNIIFLTSFLKIYARRKTRTKMVKNQAANLYYMIKIKFLHTYLSICIFLLILAKQSYWQSNIFLNFLKFSNSYQHLWYLSLSLIVIHGGLTNYLSHR